MFVACDRNYDWRQRKTQFWGRLLNFRVRMFVKSAVKLCLQKSPQIIMASSPWWNLFWHRLDNSSRAFYVWRKALSNDLKELCPATKFIKKSNSWNRHQIEWNIKITAQNSKRRYKWQPPRGGGGTPHMKWVGMLVVSLRGVNFGFWSHLGCSGQNAIIFGRKGLV